MPVTIAEQCNGVRGIFALMLVSYAFSFGLPLRNSVRFLVLLASPLVDDRLQRDPHPADGVVLRLLHARRLPTKFHEWAGWAMVPDRVPDPAGDHQGAALGDAAGDAVHAGFMR